MPRTYPLHDKAPEAPFKCIISGLRGPVVDMEKFVEGYGRVYIHTSVIAALAERHGFLAPSKSEELVELSTDAIANANVIPALVKEFLDDVVAAVSVFDARVAGLRGGDDAPAAEMAEGAAAGIGEDAFAGDGDAVVAQPGGLLEDVDGRFLQPGTPADEDAPVL